jgi:hypothetical protein
VKSNVAAAQFTPAIENGRAVSSTVRFDIAIPYDSLIAQSSRLPPNFSGTVIDTVLKMSLPKTRILVHYTDTTEDNNLTIGFSRYLLLIGNRAGQHYDGKLLVTETDSLGRFTLRMLPRGHFTVSVQSAGYEIGHFQGHISGDELNQLRYVLKPSEERSRDSTLEITTYGRQTFTEKKIVVADEEKHTGFSPLLSNVVQSKAEIRRVPEGPSKMLVRSGCPYDNMYVIAGVPMLAPFHFGGHPYADIDGVMISALSSVKVTINDIAAKRVDASGCIVEADPGRITYDNVATKGLYLKADLAMLGIDFLAAYTSKKKPSDFLQVGYSAGDGYSLKFTNWRNLSVSHGNQGIGIPLNYGNATLAGSKSVGSSRCTFFGWLAWDSYNLLKTTNTEEQNRRDSIINHGKPEKTFFPWGMGSIKITADSSTRSFTIGGAHQFFGSGKQVNSKVFTTRSYLNNGEMSADFDTIIHTPFVAKLTARINYDEWNGFCSQQVKDSIDTLWQPSGKETGGHINTSFIKQKGHITGEVDLLASIINYNSNTTKFTGDGGASLTYEGDNYQAGIHFGRVTSRPDIRGLPDSHFRMQLNSTYIASLPLFFRYSFITKFGVTPYIRYSAYAPQLDPVKQVWDPGRSTPIIAGGADFDCRIVPTSWAELSTALNLANARRFNTSNDSLTVYEWNLPWTIRTSLHLHTKSDRVHLYADYIRSKGLPYYDIDNQAYNTLPVYRSLDLNFQFRMHVPRQRYINKLDCYATVKNVLDLFNTSNVRDYYWDSNGTRQPVFLGKGRVDIGARFGIKL